MYHKRTALIKDIKLRALTTSSVVEIGDSSYIRSYARARALQREEEKFFEEEGDFSAEIFQRPLPQDELMNSVVFESVSLNPIIRVNTIDIIAVSTSSVLHLGNSRSIFLESRVKNIRHLREQR